MRALLKLIFKERQLETRYKAWSKKHISSLKTAIIKSPDDLSDSSIINNLFSTIKRFLKKLTHVGQQYERKACNFWGKSNNF